MRLLHLRKLNMSKQSLSCFVREKSKEIHKSLFDGEEEEILKKIYEISERL